MLGSGEAKGETLEWMINSPPPSRSLRLALNWDVVVVPTPELSNVVQPLTLPLTEGRVLAAEEDPSSLGLGFKPSAAGVSSRTTVSLKSMRETEPLRPPPASGLGGTPGRASGLEGGEEDEGGNVWPRGDGTDTKVGVTAVGVLTPWTTVSSFDGGGGRAAMVGERSGKQNRWTCKQRFGSALSDSEAAHTSDTATKRLSHSI